MRNIVIGSGPAGRLASVELGKLGEEVLLIEKNQIGGTCCNEGCMVICGLTDITKFIETNNKFNTLGFIKSQIEVSYEKIVEKIKETQDLFHSINQMENEMVGNTIVYGEAAIEGDSITVNGESHEYENLLIATGARPFIPDIPGKEYGLTNKDILKIDQVPEKMNIMGGGIVACEIANIYSKLGCEVNVFARSTFLKTIDSDAKEYINKKLIPEVNIYENTSIIEVDKNKVVTSNNEEYEGVPFFATGRTPNSEIVSDLVELNPDNTIKVNKLMQTSVDNVYAAGDVTGGIQLTPVARMEGICAARNMAGYANTVDYNSIGQSITLNMDVSFVKDNEVSDENLKTLSILGMVGLGGFWNTISRETGMTKITLNEDENKIKELTAISPNSLDSVAYLSYLMRIKSDLNEFDNFVELHPSNDTVNVLLKRAWL